jgi:hypothetical protein
MRALRGATYGPRNPLQAHLIEYIDTSPYILLCELLRSPTKTLYLYKLSSGGDTL